MKVLLIGDVMGKPGRQTLKEFLPQIIKDNQIEFVILNGENLAGGYGITEKIFRYMIDDLEVDCITTGNHWLDKKEILSFADHEKILIPANAGNNPVQDRGLKFFKTKSGKSLAVVNLIGRVFMHADNKDPFAAAEKLFDKIPSHICMRIVDVHAEASSEKQALAHFLDGRSSVVYGTHSHVPTADERVLENGTGFVTDLGMTGGYDSVIGIRKQSAIHRFLTGKKKDFEPSNSQRKLFGIIADINEQSGRCQQMQRIQFEAKNLISV